MRVFGYVVGEELESYEATEFDILSLVDDAHPPTTEFLDDAVVRDGLADHLEDEPRENNSLHNEHLPHFWVSVLDTVPRLLVGSLK
jgi:hypothetical protein